MVQDATFTSPSPCRNGARCLCAGWLQCRLFAPPSARLWRPARTSSHAVTLVARFHAIDVQPVYHRLCLRSRHILVRVSAQLKQGSTVHVFQRGLVIVPQCQLVLRLNQKLIRSAEMAEVVAESSHEQSILLQFACPLSSLRDLLQTENGKADIHRMLKAMIWHVLGA